MGLLEHFPPWGWELGKLMQQRQRQMNVDIAAVKSVQQPSLAQNVIANRRMFPWMAPGTQAALGLSGMGPNHPAVQLAAGLAARKAAQTGQWAQSGEWTSGVAEGLAAQANAQAQLVGQAARGANLARIAPRAAPPNLGPNFFAPSPRTPGPAPSMIAQQTGQAMPQAPPAPPELVAPPAPSSGPGAELAPPPVAQVHPLQRQEQIGNLLRSIEGGPHPLISPLGQIARPPSQGDIGAAKSGFGPGPVGRALNAVPNLGRSVLENAPVIGGATALAQGQSPIQAALRSIPGVAAGSQLDSAANTGLNQVGGFIPHNALQGVSRDVALAGQLPLDVLHSQIRAVANAAAGGGINNTWEKALYNGAQQFVAPVVKINQLLGINAPKGASPAPVDQSQAGQAVQALLKGQKVDVGAGFFPSPTSKTAELAGQASREAAPQINGHAFTIGRYVANQLFDGDSVPYKLLSGGIDALVTIGADPTNQAFGALQDVNEARGLVSGAQSAEDVEAATKASEVADLGSRLDQAEKAHVSLTTQIANLDGNLKDGQLPLNDNGTQIEDLRSQRDTLASQIDTLKEQHQLSSVEADRAAANAVARAGGQSAWRQIVDKPTVSQWLASDTGQQMVNTTAETSSPWDVWQKLGAERNQIPASVTPDFAAASTPEESMRVWQDNLGTDIREAPKPQTFFKAATIGSRFGNYILADAPHGATYIDPTDIDDAAPKIDASLKTIGASDADRREVFDKLVTSQTSGDRFDAVTTAFAKHAQTLVDEGIPRSAAERMYSLAHDKMGDQSLMNIGDIVEGRHPNPFSEYGEDGNLVWSGPHLETEQFNRQVFLPDPQDGRALARTPVIFSLAKAQMRAADYADQIADLNTRLNGLDVTDSASRDALRDQIDHVESLQRLNNAETVGARATAIIEKGVDGFMKYWKTFRLTRLGWGTRVAGEGMLSGWANGMTTPLSNPLQYLTMLASSDPESNLGKILEAASGKYEDIRGAFGDAGIDLPEAPPSRRYLNDAYGAVLGDHEMLREGLNASRLTDFLGLKVDGAPVDRMLQAFYSIGRDDPNFTQAWLEELNRLRGSDLIRGLLRQPDPESADEWFLHGAGSRIRADIASNPKFAQLATDDGLARQYIDSIMDRIDYATAGKNPDLIGYLNTGRLNNNSSVARDLIMGDYRGVTSDDLEPFRADPDAPSQMRARLELQIRDPALAKTMGDPRIDKMLDMVMYDLAPRPENYLVRAPLWKQAYWEERAPELMHFSSPEVQSDILDQAREAGVKPATLAAMEATPAHVGPGTINDTDEFSDLADTYASQRMKDVLHDLSQRSQFFQTFRNIFPFGEAYKQILARWVRNVMVNPQVIHRLDQVVGAAKEAGIFTKDPVSGQEVFVMPGTQWLTDKLTGVPVPLQGSLNGLSILGNVTPGVGPAVTLPTSYLWNKLGLGDHGAASTAIQQVFYPQGDQTVGQPSQDLIDTMLPTWAAWAERSFDNPTSSQQFASTYQAAVDYLASSGKYNLHGDDAQEQMMKLLDNAASSTRALMLIRGGVDFTAPTAAIPKPMIRDKGNKLQELSVVRDKYYAVEQQSGSGAAFDWLMKTYGPNAFTVAQPWTATNGLQPRTTAGWNYADQHSWIKDVAPDVYGVVVPESGGFDLTAYDMQFKSGSRTPATGQQRINLANNRLAQYIMDQQIAANPSIDKTALATKLQSEYPGFQSQVFNYRQTPNQIRELQALVNDPRAKTLGQSGMVSALKQYFSDRQQALEDAGTKTLTSAAANDARANLVTQARALYASNGGFARVWDSLLKYEFTQGQVPDFSKDPSTGFAASPTPVNVVPVSHANPFGLTAPPGNPLAGKLSQQPGQPAPTLGGVLETPPSGGGDGAGPMPGENPNIAAVEASRDLHKLDLPLAGSEENAAAALPTTKTSRSSSSKTSTKKTKTKKVAVSISASGKG